MWKKVVDNDNYILSLDKKGLQAIVGEEIELRKAQLAAKTKMHESLSIKSRQSYNVHLNPNSDILTIRIATDSVDYGLRIRLFDTEELEQLATQIDGHYLPLVRANLINRILVNQRIRSEETEDLKDYYAREASSLRMYVREAIERISRYKKRGMEIESTKQPRERPRVSPTTSILTAEDRALLKPYLVAIVDSFPNDLRDPFKSKAYYSKLIASF